MKREALVAPKQERGRTVKGSKAFRGLGRSGVKEVQGSERFKGRSRSGVRELKGSEMFTGQIG